MKKQLTELSNVYADAAAETGEKITILDSDTELVLKCTDTTRMIFELGETVLTNITKVTITGAEDATNIIFMAAY